MTNRASIAQVGTFDVENFGDLLFPTVLENRFVEYEIDLYSPVGHMQKPFEEDRHVYAIDELEEQCVKKHYNAIVIGGGDLIRVGRNIAANYASDFMACIGLWQLPIMIGEKYQIPVVFNCLGVPAPFGQFEGKLVKNLLQRVDYISVRDYKSKLYLENCGLDNVEVVPDTVYTIPDYYRVEELKTIHEKLIKCNIILSGSYIVFQHNTVNMEDCEKIKRVLQEVSKQRQILLLPIGYVHSDIAFMEQLLDEDNPNLFLCREKLSPKEMCAVLAGSNGYIGTSMHGAIVSFSYGKPIVSINTANMSKITGFLELIEKQDAEVRKIDDLQCVIEKQFALEYSEEIYKSVYTRIQQHFDHIKENYFDKSNKKTESYDIMKVVLENYHEMAEQMKDFPYQNFQSAKVYFDYGNGYTEGNCEEYQFVKKENEYYLEIKIKSGTQNVRIDPIENRIAVLYGLDIKIDGNEVPYIVPNACDYKGGILINSLDPMIVIENVQGNEIRVTCTPEMIDDSRICEMISDWNLRVRENESRLVMGNGKFEEQKNWLQERVQNLEREKQDLETIEKCLKEEKRQLEDLNEKLEQDNKELEQKCSEMEARKENESAEKVRLKQENAELVNYINEIYQSASWKFSTPVRAIGNSGRWLVNHSKIVHKGYTAAKILQHGGVKLLAHEIKHYNEYQAMRAESERCSAEAIYVDSEYQENEDFSDKQTDVKMLAFYLPQYHTFPENDEWWGKGFTEWTNVRSGDARFEGHYQPRVPHSDIGYYDLTHIEVLRKQAILAKQHGIYGFCFYYYWFSGKRLMEKPVDMLLEHPEIDLPFCLCWANENWTRAWDGQNKNVLIAQDYSDEDDIKFMADLKKYIDDDRYIKINGKPLVMVYNPGQIPDCHKSFAKWREVAKELGIGDILIWTCQTSNNTADLLHITDCIDAEVEFPPHNMWMDEATIRNVDLNGKSAFLFSYPKVVEEVIKRIKDSKAKKVPVHHGCMLAWDNAARRKDAWFTYCGFSLKSLYKWVAVIAEEARKDFSPEERFVFINAWNEWGEGTYLEPDEKYGYANINTVSKALMGLPLKNDLKMIGMSEKACEVAQFESKDKTVRIAVQIHMFYLDTLEETISYLNQLPYAFDCYISTNTVEKKKQIEDTMKETCKCHNLFVEVFENRGRDVAPFLMQMKERILQYDYIGHIHSKKTKTNDHGNEWRKYIFQHLFGNEEYLKRVFNLFETNPDIGILMPETYPVLELQAEWGGNKTGVQNLLKTLGIQENLPMEPVFPVGNMFWARTDAVKRIFEYGFQQSDFPAEAGQVNATIAHQIERAWVYLIKHEGYRYQKIFNNCYQRKEDLQDKRRLMAYVHYDKDNVISEEDLKTLQCYSELCDEILFVTNSNLSQEDTKKIAAYTTHILQRENTGYDFGAWKDALLKYGKEKIEKFDELILLNNSCFAPVFDIAEMFENMEKENVDFWGDTIFPFSPDGSYIGKDCIPEHIQSYFMVFNHQVLKSEAFWDFWMNLPECNEFIDVVAECESQFTKKLSDAGFTYAPYIKETYYISRFLNNYAIPYEKPCSLLLLKDAFVKKKCYEYMSEEEKIRLEYLLEQIAK